jgi:hypothetical protein
MAASANCPVCGIVADDLEALASHLVECADASDGRHVMWLNRSATKYRTSAADLELLLADGAPSSDRVKR